MEPQGEAWHPEQARQEGGEESGEVAAVVEDESKKNEEDKQHQKTEEFSDMEQGCSGVLGDVRKNSQVEEKREEPEEKEKEEEKRDEKKEEGEEGGAGTDGKGKEEQGSSTFAGRVLPLSPQKRKFFLTLKEHYFKYAAGIKGRNQQDYWRFMVEQCQADDSDEHVAKKAKRYAAHGLSQKYMMKKPAASTSGAEAGGDVKEHAEKKTDERMEKEKRCSGVPEGWRKKETEGEVKEHTEKETGDEAKEHAEKETEGEVNEHTEKKQGCSGVTEDEKTMETEGEVKEHAEESDCEVVEPGEVKER